MVVFYFLSTILVYASLRVVTLRNPVHAALHLVLAFFSASGVWILLQPELLAIALVLVYVGAVMVLFLFVVMMLDIRMDEFRKNFWKHVPVALVLGGLVAFELAAVVWTGFADMGSVSKNQASAHTMASATPPVSNTHELGVLLYTQYLYPIQAAAVILLIAMIAAIALTLRQRKDSKAINPSTQIRVRAADRLAVVKVAATQKPAAEESAQAAAEEKKA